MDQVFVTLLGTAATMPTVFRGVCAEVIQLGPNRILVDGGEGTQVALRRFAGNGPDAIDLICLTHYHADHYLGVAGFLKTRSLTPGLGPMPIICNEDCAKRLKAHLDTSFTYNYTLQVVEDGDVVDIGRNWEIHAVSAKHEVSATSYVFVEGDQPGRFDAEAARRDGAPNGREMGQLAKGNTLKLADGRVLDGNDYLGEMRRGRKIAISGDTRPLDDFTRLAQGAELMLHEGTFLHADLALAQGTGHSTCREAGEQANRAGAKNLWINHLSGRYTPTDIAAEARKYAGAANVRACRDGDRCEVKTGSILRLPTQDRLLNP